METKILKPTKGVRPHLEGVPGELILTGIPDNINFGRSQRQSPYDSLLMKLRDAGKDAVLRFGAVRAKAAVYGRAKKLNIKVLFGEQDGALFVRLAQAEVKRDTAAPDPAADTRVSNRDLVLRAVRAGKCTVETMVPWIRANGNPVITPTVVDPLLMAMLREGKVKLKDHKKGIEGDRWEAIL